MENSQYRVRLERSMGHLNSYSVWLIKYVDRKTFIAEINQNGLEWKPRNQGEFYPNPTITLPTEIITEMAKELIESGFLPEKLLSNERELKAMEKHLEDLRKISFNELGITK